MYARYAEVCNVRGRPKMLTDKTISYVNSIIECSKADDLLINEENSFAQYRNSRQNSFAQYRKSRQNSFAQYRKSRQNSAAKFISGSSSSIVHIQRNLIKSNRN